MTNREKIMLAVSIATILITGTILLTMTRRIRNVGYIKAVGIDVYWDYACATRVEEIDWGTLRPGNLAGTTVYFKNTKNTNCSVSLNTTAWQPEDAQQYLTLDWNYTGILQPEQVKPVLFTLYVNLNITHVNQFSFDIVLNATESE